MQNEEWVEVKKTKKSKQGKINHSISNFELDKVTSVEVKSFDKLKDKDIDNIFSENFDEKINSLLEQVLTSSKKNSTFENLYTADLIDFYDYLDKPSSIKITEKERKFRFYSDEEFSKFFLSYIKYEGCLN